MSCMEMMLEFYFKNGLSIRADIGKSTGKSQGLAFSQRRGGYDIGLWKITKTG